jgi:hypothetical protein
MKISKIKFLHSMHFPNEWIEFDMYPDELFSIQEKGFDIGNEEGSEHDRFGAFLWWIEYARTKDQMLKLVKLSYLDPDQLMANDVRKRIKQSSLCDEEVMNLIDSNSDSANQTNQGGVTWDIHK